MLVISMLSTRFMEDKAAEAGVTGRLSTWPVAVGYFFPEFSVEIIRGIISGDIEQDNISMEQMKEIASEVAGVEVSFNKMKEDIDNYYLIIMDSIIY